MQKFGGEASWKTTTRKTEMETGNKVEMNFKEINFEDVRWMELAQDCIQWWVLVLAVLNLGVLLPQC
jgi:hypothetical protein